MKMEPIQCSETSAYKIQTLWKYPEDNILHPQHGENLKITMAYFVITEMQFVYSKEQILNISTIIKFHLPLIFCKMFVKCK
jgi:hypothetical protein